MARIYPPAATPASRTIPTAPVVASTSAWTTVTLEAGSQLMDTNNIIDSATYGAVSSIVLGSGHPGNMRGPVPYAPDCPFWAWEIADPFSLDTNAHVAVQLKITSTPDLPYRVCIGVFDGTEPPLLNDGTGALIQCDDGATANGCIGQAGTFGNAAANISANGGMLSTVILCDKDNTRMHYGQTRSTSNTGPANGRQSTTSNPSSWSGAKLWGYFAITNNNTTTSRAGGTFAGVELRYQILQAFD